MAEKGSMCWRCRLGSAGRQTEWRGTSQERRARASISRRKRVRPANTVFASCPTRRGQDTPNGRRTTHHFVGFPLIIERAATVGHNPGSQHPDGPCLAITGAVLDQSAEAAHQTGPSPIDLPPATREGFQTRVGPTPAMPMGGSSQIPVIPARAELIRSASCPLVSLQNPPRSSAVLHREIFTNPPLPGRKEKALTHRSPSPLQPLPSVLAQFETGAGGQSKVACSASNHFRESPTSVSRCTHTTFPFSR